MARTCYTLFVLLHRLKAADLVSYLINLFDLILPHFSHVVLDLQQVSEDIPWSVLCSLMDKDDPFIASKAAKAAVILCFIKEAMPENCLAALLDWLLRRIKDAISKNNNADLIYFALSVMQALLGSNAEGIRERTYSHADLVKWYYLLFPI